jgi:hypothetical protein
MFTASSTMMIAAGLISTNDSKNRRWRTSSPTSSNIANAPTSRPSITMGTDRITTSTSEPSFLVRRVTRWIGSANTRALTDSASARMDSCLETSSSMCRPIASSCRYPNRRSAAGFQDMTISPGSHATIAVGLASTSVS